MDFNFGLVVRSGLCCSFCALPRSLLGGEAHARVLSGKVLFYL